MTLPSKKSSSAPKLFFHHFHGKHCFLRKNCYEKRFKTSFLIKKKKKKKLYSFSSPDASFPSKVLGASTTPKWFSWIEIAEWFGISNTTGEANTYQRIYYGDKKSIKKDLQDFEKTATSRIRPNEKPLWYSSQQPKIFCWRSCLVVQPSSQERTLP